MQILFLLVATILPVLAVMFLLKRAKLAKRYQKPIEKKTVVKNNQGSGGGYFYKTVIIVLGMAFVIVILKPNFFSFQNLGFVIDNDSSHVKSWIERNLVNPRLEIVKADILIRVMAEGNILVSVHGNAPQILTVKSSDYIGLKIPTGSKIWTGENGKRYVDFVAEADGMIKFDHAEYSRDSCDFKHQMPIEEKISAEKPSLEVKLAMDKMFKAASKGYVIDTNSESIIEFYKSQIAFGYLDYNKDEIMYLRSGQNLLIEMEGQEGKIALLMPEGHLKIAIPKMSGAIINQYDKVGLLILKDEAQIITKDKEEYARIILSGQRQKIANPEIEQFKLDGEAANDKVK